MNALGYYKLGRSRASAEVETIRMRIVFFGFAGGTVTALHSIAEALPDWIEVWGAEYPGRGMRWRENPLSTVDALLDDLQAGLSLLADLPFAVLGYSMGAHIAYRLALRAHFATLRAMVVMSARPPISKFDNWESESLTDTQLIARLQALGGMPPEVLNSAVMLENFLPVIRADLAVCANLNNFTPKQLSCPLLMLEGENDRLLLDAEAHRWLEVAGDSDGLSSHRRYGGGHFFHKGIEQRVASDIAEWLKSSLLDAANHESQISIKELIPA